MEKVLPAVRNHHEKWDGSGYPDRLAGRAIPVIARIICITDSFDAMTSDRPYRKALSNEQAVEELKKNAGSQFDPTLVDLFLEILDDERA
jgi:HD-GYP domain-containing protein (c-di-GMP phosphodiesterase class II)